MAEAGVTLVGVRASDPTAPRDGARAARPARTRHAAIDGPPTGAAARASRLKTWPMQLHLVDATYELFRAHYAPRPVGFAPTVATSARSSACSTRC
jgi:hypothetical protein